MQKAVLEGLLFVVGEDGLTLEQIEEGEFTGRQFALEDRCLYKPYLKEKKQ